jgi:hypothetical protein
VCVLCDSKKLNKSIKGWETKPIKVERAQQWILELALDLEQAFCYHRREGVKNGD